MWQVIGQERALSLLRSSLERKTLAHAYLFVGPPRVGKMTLALNLAQALNCETTEPPCGECTSCQKILVGKHADVQVISLESNGDAEGKPRAEISIDQIRQMQHSASLPPFEGRRKVFIIDQAEHLSIEAANSLLKTLEEPVGGVTFILLASNDRMLPATVVSRCQRLELTPLSTKEVETALTSRWQVTPQKARLLARLSHGCLGWAISAATDDSLLQRQIQKRDELFEVMEAGYEHRFAYAARLASQFSKDRSLVQEVLDLWLALWRDLLLVKASCRQNVTNVDCLDRLVGMSQGYELADIKDFIKRIQAAKQELKQNANPRLVLEVLMLSMPGKEGDSKESLAVR